MNGKIRFGVIGTNNITDWFLKGAFMDNRFELMAVCSRSKDKALEFARKHNAPLIFTSLEDMASSSEVDAIYIATPNSLHARHAILCMSHGKHVLCEKPLASNAKEVYAMIEASQRYGVALMEAMKTTLTPNFRYLLSHLNEAGKLRRFFASYCQYSSRYDKLKEGVVLNAFRPDLSNGAVMDIGVYTIYPMVTLFGKPEKIIANGLILPTGVDGQGTVMFRYPDMEASVIYSKIANSYLPSEIEGEQGTVSIYDIHDFRKMDFHSCPGRELVKWGETEYMDEYYYELKEFINVIEAEKTESSINTHSNSLVTIEIIDEIRRQVGVRFPAD